MNHPIVLPSGVWHPTFHRTVLSCFMAYAAHSDTASGTAIGKVSLTSPTEPSPNKTKKVISTGTSNRPAPVPER